MPPQLQVSALAKPLVAVEYGQRHVPLPAAHQIPSLASTLKGIQQDSAPVLKSIATQLASSKKPSAASQQGLLAIQKYLTGLAKLIEDRMGDVECRIDGHHAFRASFKPATACEAQDEQLVAHIIAELEKRIVPKASVTRPVDWDTAYANLVGAINILVKLNHDLKAFATPSLNLNLLLNADDLARLNRVATGAQCLPALANGLKAKLQHLATEAASHAKPATLDKSHAKGLETLRAAWKPLWKELVQLAHKTPDRWFDKDLRILDLRISLTQHLGAQACAKLPTPEKRKTVYTDAITAQEDLVHQLDTLLSADIFVTEIPGPLLPGFHEFHLLAKQVDVVGLTWHWSEVNRLLKADGGTSGDSNKTDSESELYVSSGSDDAGHRFRRRVASGFTEPSE